jgi:photosystem II stability/assembly factor-like uncharacterized protein
VKTTGKLKAQLMALVFASCPLWGVSAAEDASANAATTGTEQLAAVHTGIPHDAIYDMTITGANGIAVGAFGQILESKDSGASWAVVESPTQFGLFGVTIVGEHRLIVGQRGTVLVGKPGGGWEEIKSGSDARLMKVSMNASGVAVAVGEFGTVLRSKDFGKTWEIL